MARKPKISDFNPFCHGTSSKFLSSIRKHGLLPREDARCPAGGCWPGAPSVENNVYLASKKFEGQGVTCKGAADIATERFGGRPVILKVSLPASFTKYAVEDEDCIANQAGESRMRCRETAKRHGFDPDLCNSPSCDWATCIFYGTGSVAIQRAIPPKYIK